MCPRSRRFDDSHFSPELGNPRGNGPRRSGDTAETDPIVIDGDVDDVVGFHRPNHRRTRIGMSNRIADAFEQDEKNLLRLRSAGAEGGLEVEERLALSPCSG